MTLPCAATSGQERETVIRAPLLSGWEVAHTEEVLSPDQLNELAFVPSTLPEKSSDAAEHWFRCRFSSEPPAADEEIVLDFAGIATLSEVWVNGHSIRKSNSMFARHRVDVSAIVRQENELLIVCRSLAAALRARRTLQPRTRWRTRVVSEQQLRWFRTTLLGRAPGFAPEPATVGPWRPVSLLRLQNVVLEKWARHVEVMNSDGVIRSRVDVRSLGLRATPVRGWVASGDLRAEIAWEPPGDSGHYVGHASLTIPAVRHWWPHTHGDPILYPLRLELALSDGSAATFDDVPVGFRSLDFGTGFHVNRTPVFCRGVVWTPMADERRLRQRLELLRDGGFNLIRVAGTMVYEDHAFHRLCDELGLLVWQDMMFANMDYPFADPAFHDSVTAEMEAELSRLARHASTAMICGNSEIEQQVGMLGLDTTLGRDPFFSEELPGLLSKYCPGVPYMRSAPTGGDQPFRTREGVANYFGVGAYMRPLDDARTSDVGFASECLAFSNIPEPEMIDRMSLHQAGGISPTHPAWKRGVPRDGGAAWDFEDVRDHYLNLLYSADPGLLRRTDPQRYWELSTMVSGEVMAEVFGEWRRAASRCGGGIILWSADLEPGAGWGILDSTGIPKSPYWFLKRALAPCAVWMTDEGLNGIDVHISNDSAQRLTCWLRIAIFANGERRIDEAELELSVAARGTSTLSFEEILGRFVDASCSYRFGPARHDLLTASLHRERGDSAFAQCFRFPAGRSTQGMQPEDIGLSAQASLMANGFVEVLLGSRRFANGVRVFSPNMLPDDCYFGIEPGSTRRILLAPSAPVELPDRVFVTALNVEGRIAVPVERQL